MHEQFKGSIAPLRNVLALGELMKRMSEREGGLPGMATFYGPSGFGKSTAMTYCVNRYGAYHIAVRSVWRTKALCEAILREMSILPGRTVANMVDQIAQEMALSSKTLIIDEADYLVNNQMIELVRDIYEASDGPVILIGEEKLPQKLLPWERVHGRMMDWVAAQPADAEDCEHLAKLSCPDIALEPDVLPHVLQISGRSPRRIRVNFGKIKDYAKLNGLKEITAKHMAGIEFFTGAPPKGRVF